MPKNPIGTKVAKGQILKLLLTVPVALNVIGVTISLPTSPPVLITSPANGLLSVAGILPEVDKVLISIKPILLDPSGRPCVPLLCRLGIGTFGAMNKVFVCSKVLGSKSPGPTSFKSHSSIALSSKTATPITGTKEVDLQSEFSGCIHAYLSSVEVTD